MFASPQPCPTPGTFLGSVMGPPLEWPVCSEFLRAYPSLTLMVGTVPVSGPDLLNMLFGLLPQALALENAEGGRRGSKATLKASPAVLILKQVGIFSLLPVSVVRS